MVESRVRLAAIYAGDANEAAMRASKAAELTRLREALASAGLPRAGELNNARLTAAAAYHRCVPALTAELARLGNELPAFYASMKRSSATRRRARSVCPRS